jgi:hypothetical protein
MRLAKSSQIISKKRFTTLEDHQIIQLVQEFGTKWTKIESRMEERNAQQIRERYLNYLDESLKIHPWSQEEDDLLLSLAKQFPIRWEDLKKEFPGRTDVHLKNRLKFLRKAARQLKNQSDILTRNLLLQNLMNQNLVKQKIDQLFDITKENRNKTEVQNEIEIPAPILDENVFDFDENWSGF